MTTKPTILLVPGSFAPAALYDDIIAAYRSRGYPIQSLDLLSVTKKPGAAPTMYDDAAYINAEATKLADEGKDVVLMAHSYGGVPTSQGIKGVSKAERAKQGKKGGVVRIAYMTAVVPGLGENLAIVMEGSVSDYVGLDADGWMYHNDHAATAKWVFSDLSPEEGLKWVGRFTQHSAVTFGNELTYEGYKDVPVSFLFCEGDLCVTPTHQQRGIDTIEKATGKKVDVTRIPADHVPVASAPEKVVEWWISLAEKGGEE